MISFYLILTIKASLFQIGSLKPFRFKGESNKFLKLSGPPGQLNSIGKKYIQAYVAEKERVVYKRDLITEI